LKASKVKKRNDPEKYFIGEKGGAADEKG